jgi:hypothetical protein
LRGKIVAHEKQQVKHGDFRKECESTLEIGSPLICPISGGLMREPVRPSGGPENEKVAFEKEDIEQWLQRNSRRNIINHPTTNRNIKGEKLIPAADIIKQLEEYNRKKEGFAHKKTF